MTSYAIRFVLATLLLSTGGCSVQDAANAGGGSTGGGGGNSSDASEAYLFGEWTGTYAKKTSDDAAARSPTTVKAVFKAVRESELAGDFEFAFPLLDGVKVKGTFVDFARRKLHFTIEESNFSSLGLAGSVTPLNYDLVGNSLEISDERILIELTRDGARGTDGGKTQDPAAQGPLGGRWVCTDQAGRRWAFQVRSATQFFLDVTEAGAAALQLDGQVDLLTATTEAKAYDAVLTVTGGNSTKYKGLVLKVKLASESSFDLFRMDKNDLTKVVDQFPCAKTE